MEKLLLTPTEAATALGFSRSTIYMMLKSGELPAILVGKSQRIPVEALKAWVASRAQDATPPR